MVIGAASNGSSIKGDVSAVMHSLLITCKQADQYAINHGEKSGAIRESVSRDTLDGFCEVNLMTPSVSLKFHLWLLFS